MNIINCIIYKKNYLLLLVMFLTTNLLVGQNDANRILKNGIDFDFFGSSGYGSINYDRILFHPKNFTFGFRVGLGAYRFQDYLLNFNPDLVFPLSIYGTFGRNHNLELSIGNTFASLVQANRETFEPNRTLDANLKATVGYRFQSKKDFRWYGRAYLSLLSLNKEKATLWPGFSFGYLVK